MSIQRVSFFQVNALVKFVRYQIPWMIGDPLLLPDFTLNIIKVAEVC